MVTHSDDDFLPVMSLADGDGVVVSTTWGHAKCLGRSIPDVVGHSCREWCNPSDWDASLAHLRATIGQQVVRTWKRGAIGQDGRVEVCWITTSPLVTLNGRRLALCSVVPMTNEALKKDVALSRVTAFDVAAYTEDMLRGLADLARTGGLPQLQSSLQLVAGEAARIASVLRGTVN